MTVGIDLGTTNSVVGAYIDGAVQLFADDQDRILLPSAVALSLSGSVVVGQTARNRRLLDPSRTVMSVKREMGRTEEVRLGEQSLSPPQISALILSALVDRAERTLGARPTQAIITVPAYFDDAQRQATRDAGAFAGLEVLRLVNEPTAAATTYQSGAEETVLVFDLGGGTFDVSVLEREEELLEVLSSHGDTRLGGDDIDRAFYRWVIERLGRDGDVIERRPLASARLHQAVERAKHALSQKEEVRLVEPLIVEDGDVLIDVDLRVTRNELEELARPVVRKALGKVNEALRDARVRATDLDRVLLVGGATRMPLVEAMVAEHLDLPVSRDLDPDLAVAQGAAIIAARAMGTEVHTVLVDITPHTLVAGSLNPDDPFDAMVAAPIIRRGSVVPVERTESFITAYENQSGVDLPVGQGEEPLFDDVTYIGEVRLEGLPPSPAGSLVEVTYRLDLSGVLHVSAVHAASGLSAETRITKSPFRLTARQRKTARAELETLLAAHAPETTPDRSLALAMLKRAERALERAPAESGARAAVEAARATLKGLVAAPEATEAQLEAALDKLSDALLDLM
ncbi:MAG: Hsp70 family protein [Myxococcota bacterium]